MEEKAWESRGKGNIWDNEEVLKARKWKARECSGRKGSD